MKQILSLLLILGLAAGTATAQNVTDGKKITITNFYVYAKDAKIMVEWATNGAVATYNWEVQRSSDSQEFSTIGFVMGPNPAMSGDNYMFKDALKNNKATTVFYRLRHVAENGEEQYSEIISTSTK